MTFADADRSLILFEAGEGARAGLGFVWRALRFATISPKASQRLFGGVAEW